MSSATRPTHGLTLGKFAPLHAGHQAMIETALREVAALTIIMYDSPEQTPIPLPVRSAWLRQLYPQARVIEAWDGPAETGASPAIQRLHEQYVIERLGVGGISHFYSSEFYGAHMSAALGAIDRRIDPERTVIPISATMIRADPFGCRQYLHPLVYRDLITNVVLLGAPSTGKTSLAARLAEVYQTQWMPEYGREYWERHQVDRRLSQAQLVEIAVGHVEREERLLPRCNRYLFTDTNATTTYQFSLAYHGAAAAELCELADRCAARYDLVLLCDTDIPYADTWDRSGAADRAVFQKRIIADLQRRKIPYFVLRGELEARVAAARAIIERHTKYQNLLAPYADGWLA